MEKMVFSSSLIVKASDNSLSFGLHKAHFCFHHCYSKFFISIAASMSLVYSSEYKVNVINKNNIVNQLHNLLHSKLIYNIRVSSKSIEITFL